MFRGQVASLGSSNLGKVDYTAPSLDICGMLESTVKGSSSPRLAVQAVESFPYVSHQGIGQVVELARHFPSERSPSIVHGKQSFDGIRRLLSGRIRRNEQHRLCNMLFDRSMEKT